MDLPWFELPPGYQFLHCLINDAKGGDSSAVDGFAVADYLKNNEKEIFETLVNISLNLEIKIILKNLIEVFMLQQLV